MDMPAGQQHQLLSPFDPRQHRGNAPSVYPWRLMQPGDWFVVQDCDAKRANAIRGSAASHVGYCRGVKKRFSIRKAPQLGPAAVICVRTH